MSPCTLTGLTNGLTYTVTVTATNTAGTGPASTQVTVIPYPAPLDSANAQLWLDGTDPDGDGSREGTGENCETATSCTSASNVLTRWEDKSGRNHDAVQSTTAMAGSYAPASGTVSFTGNGYYQAASIGVGPDATAFAVASSTPSTYNVNGWLLGGRPANGWVFHPQSGTTTARFFGITNSGYNIQTTLPALVSPATAITDPHLHDGWISGTTTQTLNYAIDGQLGTTVANPSPRAAATFTATIGADDFDLTARRGNGTYRELIALDRALSATERRDVQEYLARKWAVPITPQAPTIATATPGDTTAAVSWTAPAWDGGSAVTSYTATATPTSGTGYATAPTRTCTAASSPCTITALTNGITYTVTVTAANTHGTGPASTSTTVTPYPSGVMTGAALDLWLDGADPATMFAGTACSGTAATTVVECWKDKSSSGTNATQGTPGIRPSMVTVNGHSVPRFQGDDYLTMSASGLPTGTTSSTQFVVAQLTDSTNTARTTLAWGANGNGTAREVVKVSASTGMRATTSGTGPAASSGAWTLNTTMLAASEFSSGTTVRIWPNGQSTASTVSGSFSTGTTGGAIGSQVTPGAYWYGPIPEIVVFSGTLTDTQRRQIEEYLARKWTSVITPQAPGTPTATAGNAQATVSWAAPSWDGGASVTGYTVTSSPGGLTCTTASTSCTVTGLTNGTAYTFTVTATNSAGTGPATGASNSVTPTGPPDPPTAVAATAADSTSSVSWTAPANNGGSAITGYTATGLPSDGSLPTRTCTSASSPCSLTGLTNGVTYTVSVTATSALGTGSASTSTTMIPYPSGVMTSSAVKLWLDGADSSRAYATTCGGGAASSTVGCWDDKSTSNNDFSQGTLGNQPTFATVNGRSVPSFDGTNDTMSGSPTLMPNGTTTSTTFLVASLTDPSPGSSGYRVAMQWGTMNVTGQGRTPAYKFTGASTVYADDANEAVTVTDSPNWSTSAKLVTTMHSSTGITMWNSGRPGVSAAGSLNTGTTHASLGSQAGSLYWYGPIPEVVVMSGTLTSAGRRQIEEYLARKWGTVITPTTPTIGTATAGNGQATVSWTAPTWNGGASVTGYTVTSSPGGLTCTTSSTSCTVTGLTNGTAYTFTVTATNSIGIGPASAASNSVTPIGPPGAPTGVTAWAADTTAWVSWTAPASNGGAAITSYTASAVPSSGSTITCSASSSPCQLTGLTTGTSYTVTVTATNSAGTGAASSSVSITPTTAQGTLLWGQNAASATVPTQFATLTSGAQWRQMSTGGFSATTTCGVRVDWTLWCGGDNDYGQVGNGTTVDQGNPVQIGTGTNWLNVVVGGWSTCGLRADRTVWCWGYNTYGGLGDGSTTQRTSPVQVGSATTWVKVAVGTQHTCATRVDGTLWCWGYNNYGHLGQGTSDSLAHSSPLQVGALTTWVRPGAGSDHTCATKSDGTLWCWGLNGDGRLGDGTTTQRNSPVQVGAATTWSGVGAGDAHTCAARSDGTAWCWGRNSNGQLGDSTTTQRSTPTQVGSATTWSALTTGINHTCGVRTTGTLWCWGANGSGQLGDGTTTQRTAPVQIGSLTGWTAVSAGYYSSAGLLTPTAPDAPTGVAATAADTSSSVSWTAPVWDGGAVITSFTATAVPSDGSLPTRTCTAASSPCTITSLTNGATYSVTVAATNAAGTGASSSAAGVIPYPTTLFASSDLRVWLDAQHSTSLSAATDCSGSNASTGTGIGCWKDRSGNGWNAPRAGSTSAVLTAGAINGKQALRFVKANPDYYAVTTAGVGAVGSNDRSVFAVAEARTSYGTASTNKAAIISAWDGMYSGLVTHANGGTTTIDTLQGDFYNTVPTAGYPSTTLSGETIISGVWSSSGGTLTGGITRHGRGVLSTASISGSWYGSPNALKIGAMGTPASGSYVYPLDGDIGELLVFDRALSSTERRAVEEYLARRWGLTVAPSAPQSVSASAASSTSASVSWTAPAWNGGASVTGYTATAYPGGATCTTSGTSCTITGLTEGVPYTVTVTATNSAGAGQGASTVVTPSAAGTLYAAGDAQGGTVGIDVFAGWSPVQESGSATTWSTGTGALASGLAHSCATRTNGTLWCWGDNTYGQLGDGTTTRRTSPTQVGSATTWSAVTIGRDHTCATRTDGTLWCWGRNGNGQLGQGDTTNRSSPGQIGALTTWSSVGAGDLHSCATRTNGTAWCWGLNSSGQVGDGTTTQRTSPVQAGSATTWSSVGLGGYHSCARRTDGTAWCWGQNTYGAVGDASTTSRSNPTQVGSATTWTSVSGGDYSSCGRRTDGTIWCWGLNTNSQLGDGTTANRTSPVQVGSGTTWATVSTDGYRTCGRRSDGTLWCWGYNTDGQVGDGTDSQRATPVQVGSITSWTSVAAGVNHACATRSDNTLWCWGVNEAGQLGIGAAHTDATTAAATLGSDTTWISASASSRGQSACALRSAGTLWCWGRNSASQLGLGDTTPRAAPTQVGSATSWKQVAVGGYFGCATRTDGTLWCWGDNADGQLGDGTTTDRSSPTQVGTATTWTGVAAGWYHACATRTDGTLWCWGDNIAGQLGDGTTTDRTAPVQVGSATTWALAAAGGYHSCATRTDGTLWCWGWNFYGTVGDGTTTDRSSPTQIGTGTTWAAPGTGGYHSCARRTDGTVWCWGDNSNGRLGDGTTTQRNSPTQAGAATTWTTFGLGENHTCARRTDSSTWCWGFNGFGQLGLSDTTERLVPTQVSTPSTSRAVGGGVASTIVIS